MKKRAPFASRMFVKMSTFHVMLWTVLHVACQSAADEAGSNPGYSSQMLPDGNTWVVKYGSDKPWNGCNYSPESHERCASLALAEIARIGKETCGLDPNQIYGCERLVPGTYISCRLECEASQKTKKQNRWLQPKAGAPVQESNQPRPSPPASTKQSIFQRAKRCSERGGVWVNDSCQIEIEE